MRKQEGGGDGIYRGPKGTERAGRTRAAEPTADVPSSAAGRQRDETRERELRQAIGGRADELAAAVARTLAVAGRVDQEADATYDARVRALDTEMQKAIAVARNRVAQQVVEHRTRITESLSSLAPSGAAANWEDAPSWTESFTGQPAVAVRVGSLTLPKGHGLNQDTVIPLLVPLLNSGNLVIASRADQSAAVAGAFVGALMRLFGSVRPGDLHCSWFDPRLRGALTPFAALREGTQPLLSPPLTDEDELEAHLNVLTKDVTRIAELLAGAHGSVAELEAVAGESGEPYRVLMLFDYPTGVTQRAFDNLIRLAERGPACGVSLLVQHDTEATACRDRDPRLLYQHATVVRKDKSVWEIDGVRRLRLDLDPSPPLELLRRVSAHVAAEGQSAAAPSVPLAELLPQPEQLCAESSVDHLDVILGRAGTKPVTFTLGDNLDQLHNVLVGGAVGQGKSNVLLTMIHAIAARYAPSEVEMYLLDFKEGLEFSKLGPQEAEPAWLPHARVLGLESDRGFGLAVLRHLRSEFDRRAELIKRAGYSDTRGLRANQPDVTMPRILVVLDEFQVLLEQKDGVSDEALRLLDTLARKGRAYGIHMVLASQTLSGIESLVIKEDSIFSQFPVRVALKTTPSESQVLLQQGNTEAARLRYRGEAIFNRDFGNPETNRRVTIAYAEPDYCTRLRNQLWQQVSDPQPPVVFASSQPAVLLETPLFTGTSASGPQAVLGVPLGVDQQPATFAFHDEPGRHLALIGPGSEPTPAQGRPPGHEALATLQACCLSLALTHEPGTARFLLLDLLSPEQSEGAHLTDLAMALQARGHLVDLVGRNALPAVLITLREELATRAAGTTEPVLYVVGWGMHRAAGLDTPDPISAERPVDTLHQLISEGPVLGAHLIAWWNSYKAYEQHVESNFAIAGLVQGFCFLRSPKSDVANVVGPFVDWQSQPNRALVFDRAGSEQGTTVVPFALLSRDELASLTR